MRWWLWLLAAIGVVAAGVAWRSGDAARESRADAAGEMVRVARRDLAQLVKATGVVKPRIGAEVRVGSRVSGVVRRLHVQVGDPVAAGELLAELEDRELRARRDEAAASLASARADLAFAESELGRRRGLRTSGVISASELDGVERAFASASARLDLGTATLETATTQLGYARIAAPIGGVVASVATQEGETVAASFAAPTFLTLIDLERLEVRAYVDETDIGRIELGQPARFTVDTYGDEEFLGRVAAVYPQAEIRDNVVNYVTVVTFEPPAGRILRPEMTATVRIELERRAGVLTLPSRAVRREGGRPFVLLPQGQTLERRWVETGARDGEGWEIVNGLEEGDQVSLGDLGEG